SVAADRFSAVNPLVQALSSSTTVTRPSGSIPRTPAPPPRRRSIPVAAITLVLGVFIGLGLLFAWRHGRGGTVETTGPRRIAVLPFENLGGSADAYFADGVTDEVRGKLAALPGLEVIARTSSGQYKQTTKSPQQIGRELGVQYLLTGTVRWEKATPSGGTSRVRVSPELIQVTTASTKWQAP